MNKTTKINLGGISFTIDEDAFKRLDLYLHELEAHFEYSESRGEIITDIEARLAELLTEKLRGRDIVTIKDVADAVKIMGAPSDIDDEPVTEQSYAKRNGRRRTAWDIKTGRRLFRNPDDKLVAGVCSGVAAYLGIEDPIWVRLGFVLASVTVGFGLFIYIAAWILVPEAKTSGDRLAMMGHSANAKNIADMIERGLDDLSETLKDNWENITKKKSDENARKYFVQKPNSFGNDVLVLPRISIPQKIVNSVKSKLKSMSNKYDDSQYV
jgi:phage shock protein PspC (stress-responsive transcriptional regulator)